MTDVVQYLASMFQPGQESISGDVADWGVSLGERWSLAWGV